MPHDIYRKKNEKKKEKRKRKRKKAIEKNKLTVQFLSGRRTGIFSLTLPNSFYFKFYLLSPSILI